MSTRVARALLAGTCAMAAVAVASHVSRNVDVRALRGSLSVFGSAFAVAALAFHAFDDDDDAPARAVVDVVHHAAGAPPPPEASGVFERTAPEASRVAYAPTVRAPSAPHEAGCATCAVTPVAGIARCTPQRR